MEVKGCPNIFQCIATPSPTRSPTVGPSQTPTMAPTQTPTMVPTAPPTMVPTQTPTMLPTAPPTMVPTVKVSSAKLSYNDSCNKLHIYLFFISTVTVLWT